MIIMILRTHSLGINQNLFQVRAASVRVSIETSLKDLRKGKESIGEGIATDGHKPTDGMLLTFVCTSLKN